MALDCPAVSGVGPERFRAAEPYWLRVCGGGDFYAAGAGFAADRCDRRGRRCGMAQQCKADRLAGRAAAQRRAQLAYPPSTRRRTAWPTKAFA